MLDPFGGPRPDINVVPFEGGFDLYVDHHITETFVHPKPSHVVVWKEDTKWKMSEHVTRNEALLLANELEYRKGPKYVTVVPIN